MSRFRRIVLARSVLLFFGVNILSQPLLTRATYGAEQTTPFNPPWTQERVKPPETENNEPLAWCENTRERKRPDGAVESYNDFRVTYTNGTEVRYEYGESRKRWIVIVPGPQGRTRTTYDLTDEKKPTRTVEEPGKKPVTSEWKEAVEALKKKGAFLFDPFANRLVRVSYPVSPVPGAAVLEPEQQLLLAATTEREKTSPAPQTQERPTINIKPVTYGGPLADPVIHLDPGPGTTPEEFVQPPPTGDPKPPQTAWNPQEDSQGPVTVPSGTAGTPVPQTPGSGINIGSGWASTRVPARVLLNCSGDDVDEPTIERAMRAIKDHVWALTGYPPTTTYTTTTRENPDGSTTTTITATWENPDGSITTATTTTRMNRDGSTTTNPDGSITRTSTRTQKNRDRSETTMEWTTREYRDGTKTSYTTKTERDPDGSTTTTMERENRDGSRYSYRKYPDDSTTTTTTERDSDGSTTTTRTDSDGFTTTTRTYSDGSTTRTTTYSDGSTTTTTTKKNPDGSWVEDRDGKITVHDPEEKPPPKP